MDSYSKEEWMDLVKMWCKGYVIVDIKVFFK